MRNIYYLILIAFFLFQISCALPPTNTSPKYLKREEFKQLSLITEAKQLAKSGRLDSAELIYRQLLKENPDHLISLNDLGYLLIIENRLEEAEVYLNRVIEIETRFIPARLNLARIYVNTDRIHLALKQFEKIEELTDLYSASQLTEIIGEPLAIDFLAELNRLRSSAYYLSGNLDEAICSSIRAVGLRPSELEQNLHARLLMSLERVDDAIFTLSNLVTNSQGNTSSSILFDYALALVAQNNFETSKILLDKVLEEGNLTPRELAAARFIRFAIEQNSSDSLVFKENFIENGLTGCKFVNFDVDNYWPYNTLILIVKSQKELCPLDSNI